MRRSFLAVLAFGVLGEVGVAKAAPCAGFTDVQDSDAFCTNVSWMKSRGITVGCSTTLYCPSDLISRLTITPFLKRLGDAVLPPNVLWVAPTGGTFQLIQAAINYAGTIATTATPVVIQVAPGTYSEAITLAPNVQLNGSGEGLTVIAPPSCGSPTAGAITMAQTSHIQNVTIRPQGGCNNGILFDAVAPNTSFYDTTVRDVRILQVGTGIRVTGFVSRVGLIKNVSMNLQQGSPNYGVVVEALGTTVTMEDVDMHISGATGSIGVRFEGGGYAYLRRFNITSGGPGGPNIYGIQTDGFGTLDVRDSTVSAIYTALHVPGTAGLTRIANTGLYGTINAPGATCFNNYNAHTLAPVTC